MTDETKHELNVSYMPSDHRGEWTQARQVNAEHQNLPFIQVGTKPFHRLVLTRERVGHQVAVSDVADAADGKRFQYVADGKRFYYTSFTANGSEIARAYSEYVQTGENTQELKSFYLLERKFARQYFDWLVKACPE